MSKKQITPNQWQQATQELSSFYLGAFKVPSKIQDGEKAEYVCVCIKSRDNQDGTAKEHSAKVCYAPVQKWREMQQEVRSGRTSGVFLGMFSKVVILHNPTMPLVAESKPKVKGLSPTQKSKIAVFLEDDMTFPEMAEALNVSLERVVAHFE
tara:strand:- start:188 stop:643 length:456 start_codon:yes stop_codon:yes gene_type:complete